MLFAGEGDRTVARGLLFDARMSYAKSLSPSTAARIRAFIERHGVMSPMAIHIHCPRCSGSLTLQTDAWSPGTGLMLGDDELEPQRWTCPYCAYCGSVKMEARLVWVVAGHGLDVLN